MLNLITILLFILGLIIGYFLRRFVALKRKTSIERKIEDLVNETKEKQKEILIQAREKALKIVEEAKKEEEGRRIGLNSSQQRLEKRESLFDEKLLQIEERQRQLYERATKLEEAKREIERIREEQLEKLERIAQLNKEEAKKVLLDNVEREIKNDLLERIKKLEKITTEEWDKKAKELLTEAIERCAFSHASESTTTIVTLPSDEMKGRIIGREGRNIKTIEQLTGVEIIVDDTPEAIIISGFSPIRRQVAKKALEKLILDGRIQPARIEEKIEEAKRELAQEIQKVGEDACYEVGIAGLDPKLVSLMGRLKFRTSYGQNVLQHSIEVAHLSSFLASELGADPILVKKAGFFHDIGKTLDHEVIGTHPDIGKDLGEKFNLDEKIITAISTHHLDKPPILEAIIVKVADAISGARIGARKETYEGYLKRLEELENLAKTFEGVEKAYAIQAGREIRIFVNPGEIDDFGATKLAKKIAKKIEEELKYPGEIKVNVIRENRIIEYAR